MKSVESAWKRQYEQTSEPSCLTEQGGKDCTLQVKEKRSAVFDHKTAPKNSRLQQA